MLPSPRAGNRATPRLGAGDPSLQLTPSSPLVPEQRFQQMTQPQPDVQVQKNGLQPKTSLNGRGSDAAV